MDKRSMHKNLPVQFVVSICYVAQLHFLLCTRDSTFSSDQAMGWPTEATDFSLLHNVHTCTDAQSAFHSMDTGVSAPRDKAVGQEGDQSPSGTEVKNDMSYTSTPSLYLLGVDRDKLNLMYYLVVQYLPHVE